MQKYKSSLKIFSVIALSGLLMANTKCEQKPEGRRLKKNVGVIGVEASNFMDNSGFNFSETAQSQLSGVLFETNHFYKRTHFPTPDDGKMENFPNSSKMAFDNKMMTQLKTWIPNYKSNGVGLTRESSCLISRPQHLIYGKINSLEAYSGVSLQFGFSPTVTPLAPSGHIKLDKMRMEISMHAYNPWTQQEVGAVNAEDFKNDYAAGFGIDLGIIHIGPEFYRKTGLAEVTQKTLRKGINELASFLLAKDRQEWQTRVMVAQDNRVVIVGGAELGLKKGDLLKVENEVHTWMGEPCGESSVLLGSSSITANPWIIRIDDAGDLMSVGTPLNIDENNSINVGALVRLHQLVEDIPAPASNPTSTPKQ